jgi:hypothetical protein
MNTWQLQDPRMAEVFRQAVTVGGELLALTERTPEQEEAVFNFKRKVIQGVVTRVDVLPDKTTEVHTEFDLSDSPSGVFCISDTLVCSR